MASVNAATSTQKEELLERVARLIEQRPAPCRDEPRRFVDWPSAGLAARVFIGGIQVPDTDDGAIESAVLDTFFAGHAPNGVGIWSMGGEKEGVYVGFPPYGEVRNWAKANLTLSPILMVSLDEDVVLVTDEQLRYAVLGAPPSAINTVDTQFGGKRGFCDRLLQHIENGEIGFGDLDKQWAAEFLHAWSCHSAEDSL